MYLKVLPKSSKSLFNCVIFIQNNKKINVSTNAEKNEIRGYRNGWRQWRGMPINLHIKYYFLEATFYLLLNFLLFMISEINADMRTGIRVRIDKYFVQIT